MHVHIEQHSPTVQHKVREGKLVDYWTPFAADPDTQKSTTGYINSDTIGAIELVAWKYQVLKELNDILQRNRRPPGGYVLCSFCRNVSGRSVLVV